MARATLFRWALDATLQGVLPVHVASVTRALCSDWHLKTRQHLQEADVARALKEADAPPTCDAGGIATRDGDCEVAFLLHLAEKFLLSSSISDAERAVQSQCAKRVGKDAALERFIADPDLLCALVQDALPGVDDSIWSDVASGPANERVFKAFAVAYYFGGVTVLFDSISVTSSDAAIYLSLLFKRGASRCPLPSDDDPRSVVLWMKEQNERVKSGVTLRVGMAHTGVAMAAASASYEQWVRNMCSCLNVGRPCEDLVGTNHPRNRIAAHALAGLSNSLREEAEAEARALEALDRDLTAAQAQKQQEIERVKNVVKVECLKQLEPSSTREKTLMVMLAKEREKFSKVNKELAQVRMELKQALETNLVIPDNVQAEARVAAVLEELELAKQQAESSTGGAAADVALLEQLEAQEARIQELELEVVTKTALTEQYETDMLDLMGQVDDLSLEQTKMQEKESKQLDGMIAALMELKGQIEKPGEKESHSSESIAEKLDNLCTMFGGGEVSAPSRLRAATVAIASSPSSSGSASDQDGLRAEVEILKVKLELAQHELECKDLEIEELTQGMDEGASGERIRVLEQEVAALEERNAELEKLAGDKKGSGDKDGDKKESKPTKSEKRKSVSRDDYSKLKKRLKSKEKLAKELLEAKITLSNEVKALRGEAGESEPSERDGGESPEMGRSRVSASTRTRSHNFIGRVEKRPSGTSLTGSEACSTEGSDEKIPTVQEIRDRIIELETRYSMHQCSWRSITHAVRIIHEPDPVARKHLASQINW